MVTLRAFSRLALSLQQAGVPLTVLRFRINEQVRFIVVQPVCNCHAMDFQTGVITSTEFLQVRYACGKVFQETLRL